MAVRQRVDDVYLRPPVTTVDEAVERMEQITAYIETHALYPNLDGLNCFNYLYTVITKRIREGIATGFFEDRLFLTQLDVEFANRYFDALRAAAVNSNVPRVWRSLLDKRSNRRIEPIQFAIAGVNAHINYDLAVAVVETCTALRTEPNSGTQRSDYQKVNQIFAEEMTGLRQHYENALARIIDGVTAPVLDVVCNWSVVTARNAAWNAAERLWDIRRRGEPEEAFVARLDKFAAMSGDVLLTPLI